MKTIPCKTIALLIGALLFVPLSPATVRADDDDWEDRWEEFEDDWDDDDDDDGRWRHRGWYGHSPYGYREYYPAPRYYRYYRGHREYYPRHRVYRYDDRYPRYYDYYGGYVHAGPVDVHYGRHGAVRIGPFHVDW
jgi:hypothetical protein